MSAPSRPTLGQDAASAWLADLEAARLAVVKAARALVPIRGRPDQLALSDLQLAVIALAIVEARQPGKEEES